MDRFSNLNNILAFVTVARTGSVSRAAEQLNLTQPAISHQIKRLAAETGLTLFIRTANGLEITPDGASVLTKAEKVLEAMTDFSRSARQRSGQIPGQIQGQLRIGTVVDPEFIRLGRLLAEIRQEHPQIETHLAQGVSGTILNWLRRGQIDVGYYLSAPEDQPDDLSPKDTDSKTDSRIHHIKLATFQYHVIAPPEWQAQVEQADWPTLAALPWIGTPEVSVHHHLLHRIFAQHGLKQNVVAQVDQEPSMLEMVRSGIGLSLCRDSIALHQKQTQGLSICTTVSVPACLNFAVMQNNLDRPVVTETLRLLQQIW